MANVQTINVGSKMGRIPTSVWRSVLKIAGVLNAPPSAEMNSTTTRLLAACIPIGSSRPLSSNGRIPKKKLKRR